ncbi:chromosome partitioning protein ParA [Clostridia bacterium]|nr:chromosome partitioning protein ParA [Clostridia bacterium]
MKKTKSAKKIAITYEKGGCGKTTTAVNLSAILADKGYRVLLVDLDRQSYATNYYDLYSEDNPSIFEVMLGTVHPAAATVSTTLENLFMLPCNRNFKAIETILMTKTKRQEYTLKSVLDPIENDYDYIIFDCPPSGERIKENALTAADYVILPLIPDDFATSGLLQISQEILEVKRYTNLNIEVLGVLITQFENTNNKKAYTEAFQNQTLLPCFKAIIRKNTALSEAINHHLPINKYKPNSHGCEDYTKLTNEILVLLEKGAH